MNAKILDELLLEIRSELLTRLRQTRLAPLITGKGSTLGPGYNDIGIISGSKDPAFVQRFGQSLDKVEDSDIAALMLYLPQQDSIVESLSKLLDHIYEAPLEKTGLPYFDEWQVRHDNPKEEEVVRWSNRKQGRARELLAKGFRIAKSKPCQTGLSGVFVTVFVKN